MLLEGRVGIGLGGRGFGGGLGDVEEGEEDAAEGGFAASGVVPFLKGVDASSSSTCSYSYCLYFFRKRDVGVGGTETRFGADDEVAVHGAEGVEDGCVVGQGGGGAISYGFDVDFEWSVRGVWCGGAGDEMVKNVVDLSGDAGELGGICGAEVEQGGG